MFERFTNRARKIVAMANQEAIRFNHQCIGTEHILLGLVKEGRGVGAAVLKNLDVDLVMVSREVESLMKPGPDKIHQDRLPQTPAFKKAIEYAMEEAKSLDHHYIGSEHLLLGLFHERDNVAAAVLTKMGLQLPRVRDEVVKLIGSRLS